MATTATRGRSGPSWAGVCGTGPAATRTTGWNRITAVSRAATGPCGVSSAPDRPPGSAGLTTSSATSSAPAPATTSTSPPTAVDCSCSAGPRPCWPSSKRPDRPSPQVQRQAPYSLARGLTEPSGVQVVNVPGAGGTIGLAQFVTGKKRGNNLLVTGLGMIGAIRINKAPVTLDQVTPLARLTGEYQPLVVSADSPIKTLADLQAKFKADPG